MTNTTEAAIVATTDARLLTGSADDWRLGIAAAPADEEREETEELKGAALDEALEAAGLPKTGTADEKRARLAEHQAGDTPAEKSTNTPE